MNCTPLDANATLVNLVAFKWLMAGRGWRVDLTRLQRDAAYASECASRARDSGVQALEAQAALVLTAAASAHGMVGFAA
jgi:hypothetical protein